MRVAVVQQRAGTDPEANLAQSEAGIHEAAHQGAQLILLQELHRTRYCCQHESVANFDLAESVPGPSTDRLGAVAAALGVVIVGSVFERRAAGVYHNTAVVLDADGRLAGLYRKMHIPDDPGFHEKFYFTPGDAAASDGRSGFSPVDTAVGRLGVLVCWDQWYPEAARLMALADARLLLYPSAIGWDEQDEPDEQQRQLDAWLTIQRAQGIANGVPVLVANRVGFEPAPDGHGGIDFWGNSFISGAQGEILSRAGEREEKVLTADLDTARTEQLRRIWPWFRDRRIDAYGDLLKRYRD
jgi:N-carbamoylputrescine amidase